MMGLDKSMISIFLQKEINITVGDIGYKTKGIIEGADDFGVLFIEKAIGSPKKYFPYFNIIEIEEIEKE